MCSNIGSMADTIKTLLTILLVLIIAIVFFVGVDYFSYRLKSQQSKLTSNVASESIEKKVEQNKVVTKIIDGDTIIVEGETIRLLGMDADEKGEKCYDAAKKKLSELLLNKVVDLEYFNEDTDAYGRKLRYVILDGENINLWLVKNGYVIARVSNDPYKEMFVEAEQFARENKIGCKWQEDWQETQTTQTTQTETQQTQSQSQTQTQSSASALVIWACDAYKYIGKNATVEGLVVTVKKTTKVAFLNFERPYPDQCFTAVIFASKFSLFPDVYGYKDKRIRVSGMIKEYEGKPEIILESQSQIEVVG
jgi:endonuclease YncB( thermonuclease family)